MNAGDTERMHSVSMSATEIDGFLYEQGHAILSMANSGDAYAVPVSSGYDGDVIFLYLIRFDGQSRKLEFSAGTETVCLTAYDIKGRSGGSVSSSMGGSIQFQTRKSIIWTITRGSRAFVHPTGRLPGSDRRRCPSSR